MFIKRFLQIRSSIKFFNQANEKWNMRKHAMATGQTQLGHRLCAEVIRLCQLAIQDDKDNGDSYAFLANALSSAADQFSRHANSGQYDFLHSRAAAVYQLWYTLPNRSRITNRGASEIAERIRRMTVDEVKKIRGLSEQEAIALMDSYKRSLAEDTISPSSFAEISRVICSSPS